MLATLGTGLAVSSVGFSGCYGGFALTRKLFAFNGTVKNKWLRWLVFLLFFVFGVYGVTSLVDALVLNSIEFWSGKRPVSQGTAVQEGGQKALVQAQSQEHIVIDLERGQTKVARVALIRLDDAILLESSDGKRYYVRDHSDLTEHTQIVNEQGEALASMSQDTWKRAESAAAQGGSHALAMQQVWMDQAPATPTQATL